MKPLTQQQVDTITDMLDQKGLSPALRDDLLDHYCCAVETAMDAGVDFPEALATAGHHICPGGPEEIQFETLHILSQPKINPMKKFLYAISFLSVVGLTVGMFFKILHWPGANVLMLIGTVLLVSTLLPLFFHNMYRNADHADVKLKAKVISGYLGFACLALGILFKNLHWPGANVILGSGLIVLNLIYFPLVFLKMYRRSVG
jgi:hypothetical protein